MASFDGLDRMKALLSELGSPERNLRVIHIAGTNGKGSTAVMIASVLEEAGCSVGLYTSPHLEDECERVQIWDGTHRMIERGELDALKESVKRTGDELAERPIPGRDDGAVYGEPTVFEVYTAAAHLYFAEHKPDYTVLETGLGGRLDSTNTIEKPLVSVITQVGLDHTRELGDTIYKIAREKAGIIKDGVPVVSQTGELAVFNILKRTAEEHGCEIINVALMLDKYRGLKLSMEGAHQLRNAATAVEAIRAAGIDVSDEAIEAGLAKAVLAGRFELIGEGPYWIIDGAHNPDAIAALVEAYSDFARAKKIKRTLVIFGCMQDKNSVRMIQLMTAGLRGCTYIAAAVDYGRAEDPGRIGEIIRANGRSCTVCDSVAEAFNVANASGCECVLVTGSIYLAGEMRSLYFKNSN